MFVFRSRTSLPSPARQTTAVRQPIGSPQAAPVVEEPRQQQPQPQQQVVGRIVPEFTRLTAGNEATNTLGRCKI